MPDGGGKMSSNMCRLALAATAVAVVVATDLSAGDYHEQSTLACGDCHIMHTSAPTEGGGADQPAGNGFQVPAGLLRDDINDLCLSCHDASSRATDVLGGNSGRHSGDVRQAGSLNRMGRSGLPSTGHTLDSLAHAPGSSPPWKPEDENGAGKGLNCINCHAPHGGQESVPTYRNLRSDAGNNPLGAGLITYNHDSPGTNNPGRDVFVRRSLDFDEAAVDFNEPDPTGSAIGRFCAGCHNLFHGSPGDANIGGTVEGQGYRGFRRHPSGGVNVGAVGGQGSSAALFASRTNRVKVMSEAGEWDIPGADVTPTCITCHKAHGNDNPFGLIYRSGSGSLTENGDAGGSTLESLCQQCHVQGLDDPLF